MKDRLQGTRSYGPDWLLVGLWLLLAGAPLPLSMWLVGRDGPRPDLLCMLFASAAPPVLIAGFASRFRVTFTSESFVYRRWGTTIKVRYADISRIEVANVTLVGREAVGVFIVTGQGDRYPFWPKLFPREAVTRFFRLDGSQQDRRR